jgi:hypothetical protein
LHPIPHSSQHVIKSSDETLVYNYYPEAIQILSEAASAIPKAQQEPQLA